MDKNKIKMKYHMGVWKELPEYPTYEDIIYELNLYLIKDGRPDGDFTEQTFNSFLPSGWISTQHGSVIKKMIEEGIFEKTERTSGGKSWYKIKENPHI